MFCQKEKKERAFNNGHPISLYKNNDIIILRDAASERESKI